MGSPGSLVMSIENGNAISEGPRLNNEASLSLSLGSVCLEGHLGTW